MAARCPYCSGDSCQDRFDQALAREFTDPAYGGVHHLTVTAFMLQHDRYSHAGWLAARSLLAKFLRGGLDPAEERRRFERTDAMTRGPGFARFDELRWTRNITDLDMTDADAYRRSVSDWAASVLADAERLA